MISNSVFGGFYIQIFFHSKTVHCKTLIILNPIKKMACELDILRWKLNI